MKLLLDQGTPRSSAALLRQAGFDAVHTGEIGMAEAQDRAILRKAREEARGVVTLDADFQALMAISGASLPSIIHLRIQGLKSEPLVALLLRVLKQCSSDLASGVLISVQYHRLRMHRLPISPNARVY